MIRFALMCALTVFILLFSAPESASASDPVPPPSMAADTGQEALLDALIVHSRSVMQIGLDGLDGEGADLIRTLAGPSQFVVFGEAHGNAGIAHFATALWQELRRDGFRYAVVEADPWTASALERELRLGGIDGWAQFAEDSGGALSAPFFTWREEAAWADAIVSSAGADASPSLGCRPGICGVRASLARPRRAGGVRLAGVPDRWRACLGGSWRPVLACAS